MNKVARTCSLGSERIASMTFPALEWHVPRVGQEVRRFVLSNGLVVYSQPEHSLPLFALDFRARGGNLHEQKDRKRLTSVALSLLRTGGTARHAPEEFDEMVDFHGLTIRSLSRLETSQLVCYGLSSKLETALNTMVELITEPRFDNDKLTILKEQWGEALRRRNDNPNEVATREFSYKLYGDDPQGWDDNIDNIRAFTPELVRAWHERVWDPSHSFLAVSGDFDEEKLLDLLENTLGQWQPRNDEVPPLPELAGQANQGTFLIPNKSTQSSICLGTLGVNRFDKQLPVLEIGNYILGGGSFSSRLMDKVRTRDGLAYSIYSIVDLTTYRRGRLMINVQTRTDATQRVIEAVAAELERMRRQEVTAAELQQAKEALNNSVLMAFADVDDAVSALMQLEIIGWPSDYYEHYFERLKSVTADDVLEVSQRVYRIEDMLTIVVGDQEGLAKSCPDSAQWQVYKPN